MLQKILAHNNDLKTGWVIKVNRSINLLPCCMASLIVDNQHNHHSAPMPSYADYKTSYSSYEQKAPLNSSSDNIGKTSRSNSSCSSFNSSSSRSSSSSSTSSHSSFSSSSSNSILSFDAFHSKYDGKRKRPILDTPNKRVFSSVNDSYNKSNTKSHVSKSEIAVRKPRSQSQQQQIKLPYPVLADHRDSQSILIVLQKEIQTTNKKICDVTKQIEDKEKRLATSTNNNNRKLLKYERTKLKQQLDTLKKHERRVNLQIDYITTKMEIKGLEAETNKKKLTSNTTTDELSDNTNGNGNATGSEENQQQIKMLCSKLRQKLDKMKVYMKARNDEMKKALSSTKQHKQNNRNKRSTTNNNDYNNSKQSSSSSNNREMKTKGIENNNKEKHRSSTSTSHQQAPSTTSSHKKPVRSSINNERIRPNNLHQSSSTGSHSSTVRRSHLTNNQTSTAPKFKLASRMSTSESTIIKSHSSPSAITPTVRFIQKTNGDPVKNSTTTTTTNNNHITTMTPPPPSENSIVIQQPTPACSSFSSLSPVSSSSNGGYGTSSITMNSDEKNTLPLSEPLQEDADSFEEDDEDIDVSDIFDQTDDEMNDDELEIVEFNEGDILKLQAEMDALERRLKLKREKETRTNDTKK
ncbi:unnamed protein product [Didymodactylos carnosus]|uniref:Uncharacterized protein n=1 Tax=Didymodactylos carnosus TaxID=1234261 RepID=A0A813S8C7_9BILA|nr:unnamed protein product [Didymodactylos carnosus]CAF3575181.1 unnamed protein product [Didymodactylos carnosus]